MVQTKNSESLIGKISCYLQIVSKDPHSTAFVPLAEAFRQIGLLDDALAAARLGTQSLPSFSPGFATLGQVLAQMGQFDEAMTAYYQALAIDRQGLSALVGLVRLHLIRGEREQARTILNQAIEFHPEDEMLANMLLALDLPRPWAEPASSVSPVAEKQPDVAGAAAGTEVEGAPIPTATLAEIYVKQGLIDQAIKVYEEILRLEPGNAGVQERLAALRPPVAAAVQQQADASQVPPREVAAAPEVSSPRKPLDVFTAWLEVIAQRRVHVR